MPLEVKKERLHAVEALEAAHLRPRSTLATKAREQEVLVEGRATAAGTAARARNKLVHFAGEAAIGEVVTVRIERTTAWSLQGTTADDALPLML